MFIKKKSEVKQILTEDQTSPYQHVQAELNSPPATKPQYIQSKSLERTILVTMKMHLTNTAIFNVAATNRSRIETILPVCYRHKAIFRIGGHAQPSQLVHRQGADRNGDAIGAYPSLPPSVGPHFIIVHTQ